MLKNWEEFLESIESKKDFIEWLNDRDIIDEKNLNSKNIIDVINYFLDKNKDIITKTALADCHAVGLNSFILNYDPKVRLFICESNCELFEKYNPENPIIPIHPHKYNDFFFQISGKLIHHIYDIKKGGGIFLNKYNFIRLNNLNTEIVNLGEIELKYIGEFSNINKLRSKALHTASVSGYYPSWLIVEGKSDERFSEILYHKNLKKKDYLYNTISNPIGYLKNYLEKIA